MSYKSFLLVVGLFLFVGCGSTSEGGIGDLLASDTPTPAPLTSFSFQPVCEKQSSVDRTPAYEPTSDTVHPFVMFSKGHYDFADSFTNISASTLTYIPDTWINEFTKDDLATTELVVCVEQTNIKKVETCDGYTDDESPNEEFVLELYDVTYDVKLYAAHSAEIVDTITITANSDECPMFAMFDDPVETRYAQPFESDELKTFLEQYVTPAGS